MKRPFLAGLLALGGLGVAAACNEVVLPDATGSIALQVTLAGEPAAGGPARAPGQPGGHLTSATATATGPTTKTVTLSGGTATTEFTGTITGLAPGGYSVTVQGFVNSEVDYYGQTAGVTVASGATATANITFQSFVPTLTAFPAATTWSFRPAVSITAVPNASSYIIEVDRSNSFPNPVETTVASATGASFAVSDTGMHYVRVRAANAAVSGGGRVSATQAVRIVTDLRPSGDNGLLATNLGFGSVAGRTLDSLNIFPAADDDWFRLQECNGDSVRITAQAVRLTPASPLNSRLQVFTRRNGRLLATNDDADSTDARVAMRLPADDTLLVRVLGSNNTVGHYKLVTQVVTGANNLGAGCRLQPLAVVSGSTGQYHTCALRADGTLDCWGRNAFGELGNGTSGNATSSPTRVTGSQSWAWVTAGGLHTCGLTGAGAVYCWGRNANGQLGAGNQTDASSPTAVTGGRTYGIVSAGLFHTCAVTTAGTPYCWGSNLNGKLGDGSTTSSAVPVVVATTLVFDAIGAGEQHSCALTTTGSIYCWGDNTYGQLGNGNNNPSSSPVFVGSGYIALAVGGYHACGLTSGGGVNCWGHGVYGQLGDDLFTHSNIPVTVAGLLTFNGITAGTFHTCGTVGTTAYCWGVNWRGQVGDNSITYRGQPVPVATGVTFSYLGAGAGHTCGLENGTGNGYCWGWNVFGQLGDGSPFDHTAPVAIAGVASPSKVSTGNAHTCAVTSTGAAHCWGWNALGQLGDATFTDRAAPGPVSGLASGITDIGAGQEHSCAMTGAGVVYCWGDNSDGQLGDGTGATSNVPVTLTAPPPTPFTAISVGDWHACGLGQNNVVYCWGDNTDGQIGNNSTFDAISPVPISSALTFKQVSAGGALTCALSSGNAAYCWGDNSYGGVGNGSTGGSPVTMPTQVQAGTTTFSYVSAGYDFACGVASNGVGYCWGNNYAGQLGNGTTNPSSNPVQVSGGLTWKVIRAGRTASVCGITTTDLLYCWGSNFLGQLGNGTFNDVPVPTRVLAAGAFQWAQPADTHACGISAGPAVYCWGEDVRGQLGKGWETNAQRTPVPVLIGPATAPVPVTELSGSSRSVDSGLPRPEATGTGTPRKGNRPRHR